MTIHAAKPLCSVSKLSTESVGSRRELVANCDHTADADATQLSASAVGFRCVVKQSCSLYIFAIVSSNRLYRNTKRSPSYHLIKFNITDVVTPIQFEMNECKTSIYDLSSTGIPFPANRPTCTNAVHEFYRRIFAAIIWKKTYDIQRVSRQAMLDAKRGTDKIKQKLYCNLYRHLYLQKNARIHRNAKLARRALRFAFLLREKLPMWATA